MSMWNILKRKNKGGINMWVNISGARVKIASYYGIGWLARDKENKVVVLTGYDCVKYKIKCTNNDDINLKLGILDKACVTDNNNPNELVFEGYGYDGI